MEIWWKIVLQQRSECVFWDFMAHKKNLMLKKLRKEYFKSLERWKILFNKYLNLKYFVFWLLDCRLSWVVLNIKGDFQSSNFIVRKQQTYRWIWGLRLSNGQSQEKEQDELRWNHFVIAEALADCAVDRERAPFIRKVLINYPYLFNYLWCNLLFAILVIFSHQLR